VTILRLKAEGAAVMIADADDSTAITALKKFRSDFQEALKKLEELSPEVRKLDLDELRKMYRDSDRIFERLILDLSKRQSSS